MRQVATDLKCPACGTPLSKEGRSAGLCPGCILELALESPSLMEELEAANGAGGVGGEGLEDIFVADLRLEKEFAASGSTSLTFSIDAFNIFNEGYVLDRIRNLNSPIANWVRETLSPRVYRLGVRLNWR